MGSNNILTRFRVLKIDRMEPRELIVVDDKREYTQDEIKDLVNMIDMGNRTRAGQRNNVGGVARIVSAFGIVGKIIKHFLFKHTVNNCTYISFYICIKCNNLYSFNTHFEIQAFILWYMHFLFCSLLPPLFYIINTNVET